MNIDLSSVGGGHELSSYESYVLCSNHLCRKIMEVNYEDFNYIIVSMKIYNLLENSSIFRKENAISPGESDGVWHIGYLNEFKVYVDMTMDPNTILLRHDKQIMRENKINSILNGSDTNNYVYIDVIGC